MDVTLAPERFHGTEARAGPQRSERDCEDCVVLLVFLPPGVVQARLVPTPAFRME
jgi:hypothetical protein